MFNTKPDIVGQFARIANAADKYSQDVRALLHAAGASDKQARPGFVIPLPIRKSCCLAAAAYDLTNSVLIVTSHNGQQAQHRVQRVTVQIDRYVTAIGETDQRVKGLVDKIKTLEAERVGLEARLALIDGETGGAANVVSLHPAALDRFRDNVETIHAALTVGTDGEKLGALPSAFSEPIREGYRSRNPAKTGV